tara:strand:+ start:3170 stop:4078 length:909 start_codon:yes stop_codon:yes gene_type:complete
VSFQKTECINKELFSQNSSEEIVLFEISNIANTSDIIRFHGGSNAIKDSLVFDSLEYFFIPNSIEGLEDRNDGSLARPTLDLINIDGFFSKYIIDKDDLIGADVKIIRTFLRFLDAVNFLNYSSDTEFWNQMGVNPDPNSKLKDQIFIINQKITENKNLIKYELSSPLDLENVSIPKRQIINNYCAWKYRGKGCFYSGDPKADSNNAVFTGTLNNRGEWVEGISYSKNDFVFVSIKDGNKTRKVFYVCITANTSDGDNKPTVNSKVWAQDSCSKSLKGCKLRYTGEKNDHLPFGGFPGSRLF